jgi:hypothetical protein
MSHDHFLSSDFDHQPVMVGGFIAQTDSLSKRFCRLGQSLKTFPHFRFFSIVSPIFYLLAVIFFVFKSFPVYFRTPSYYWSFGVARRGRGLNFQDSFCRMDKVQAIIHFLTESKNQLGDYV